MASSLAAQLAQIAANSTKSLNVKAQKAAHGQSLIFEARVAASQSFDSIYTLCHEGFEELCMLDRRFLEFQRNIFSEQSQDEDRTQMTATQNAELDKILESFLGLIGGRLRLNPAVKAVEWLIRRFRIHEYNTSFLLTTFLPYHTLPVFKTLLSILPSNITPAYKFLHPYIRSLTQPPRRVIVYTATNNPAFASLLNSYILTVSHKRQHYPALISFWAGVMTEAVGGMMEKSRSGRQGVQMQNEQDVILRLLPTLNKGLGMDKIPELHIGCYMLLSLMASKGGLEDKLLNVMMEAVVFGWTSTTFMPGLVCLSILAQHRAAKQITKRLTKELLKVPGLSDLLVEVSKQQRVDKLANGLCLALIDRLSKNGDDSVLSIVEPVVRNELLNDAQITVVMKSLLLAAYRLDDSIDTDGSARNRLAKSLKLLAELPGNLGSLVRGAMEDTSIDMDELELRLQAVIRPKDPLAPAPEDSVMEDINQIEPTKRSTFESSLSALPTRTVDETSFLCHSKSHIYDQLCHTFLVSLTRAEDIERFENAPILQRDDAITATLHFSFFMRVWSGLYPVLARVAALQTVTRRLNSIKSPTVDFQALIPYAVVALGDSSGKARRAAAELIVAIGQLYPVDADLKKHQTGLRQWAFDDLYGRGKDRKELHWLSMDHAIRFLRDILTPTLEECVLDKGHVNSVLENVLNSPKDQSDTTKKRAPVRLSQTLRLSIMLFLASNVIYTPLYLVKLKLLRGLNRVRGVASTTRTKVLLLELQRWATLKPTDALQHCKEAQIGIEEFDDQAVTIVVSNDAEGLDYLAQICRNEVSTDRPTLLAATFRRIHKMWPSLKGDLRIKTAQLLLDISQKPSEEAAHGSIAQEEAMSLLSTVPLSTDILLSFLNQLPTAAKLADKPPASKRRRISHGEVARASLQDSKQLTGAIQKVNFVLQLIDGSNPSAHPTLLAGLFNILAELQHFKIQVGSELGYLQGLVLSSLLAIMSAYKTDRTLKLNRTVVRADLLVDCVQKTTSPQVQNAALLIIASLSEIAPELVLHSVMPIFTFMGSSVLRQNDDYSAHVISQTIDKVIPPLIASLRKEKGSPITGAAELLLSFVAAYEHVPAHRRKGLFSSLVRTLGPEDFLFALLAMLADKYGVTDDIKRFAVDLSGTFAINIQLQAVSKYLDLVSDLLKPKPTISTMLLSTSDSTAKDPNRVALNQLILLPHFLSQRKLIDQVEKLLERDDMDSSRIRDLYSALLENVLALADVVKHDKRLHSACGDVLESLLGLLSTSEFVKAVESLLDRPKDDLRRKVLRSLEVRIDQENQANASSRLAMLNFLPQLTAIIRESSDILYKHTAVACVDKISEKYGKKDLEAVAAAAQTIASEHCLGQEDTRLRVMALLCLASLVEILREGIVPVLPVAITKALEYIEQSLEEEDMKLHNAAYAFISALVHRLPYIISGAYLDKLLLTSYDSAETELDEESDESRIQCLQLAAKQIDAKNMFGALAHSWDNAAESGSLALQQYFQVLSIAIDTHPKSIVTKYSSVLSSIFLNAFDLRRKWLLSQDDDLSIDTISEIEESVNSVAIKMIYKFNNSTFRPIFGKLLEWASSGLPKKDKQGRILRLQSVYAFLAVFFESLKSIVTSYPTYFLDNVVEVLQTVDAKSEDSKELWMRALRTLTQCFKHDQDDFWQSPAHFDAITPALTTQFIHASSLPLVEELVPTIVELAAAADSADHHKELNSAILKHMRSESASVRLAAVKCGQALTDRLGEEWLSMLPEMLPFISELQEDDDELVEKETHRWIVKIEDVLGESLDSMLQ